MEVSEDVLKSRGQSLVEVRTLLEVLGGVRDALRVVGAKARLRGGRGGGVIGGGLEAVNSGGVVASGCSSTILSIPRIVLKVEGTYVWTLC